MNTRAGFLPLLLLGIALVLVIEPTWAGYKARIWEIGARDSYPASLTSEGVTIAAEPLFTNTLAARAFDRDDIVTRGIMPLAIIIFNDNNFPVEVDGMSIELINGDDHTRTLPPNEVVYRLFRKDKTWISQPIPRLSRSELNKDALDDFDNKFLMDKTVAPHSKGGGFLYLHIRDAKDLASYLSGSVVYIPKIYRQDNGSRMIFFEIGLDAAVKAAPRS